MPIKDTDRVARANYRNKIRRITLEFYLNDHDEPLEQQLNKWISEGETAQGYIKRLIREDLEKQ